MNPLFLVALIAAAMTAVVIAVILWAVAEKQIRNGAAQPATSSGMIRLARTTSRGRRLYVVMVILQAVCILGVFYLVVRTW